MQKEMRLLSKRFQDNFTEKELKELLKVIPEIKNIFISLSHGEGVGINVSKWVTRVTRVSR